MPAHRETLRLIRVIQHHKCNGTVCILESHSLQALRPQTGRIDADRAGMNKLTDVADRGVVLRVGNLVRFSAAVYRYKPAIIGATPCIWPILPIKRKSQQDHGLGPLARRLNDQLFSIGQQVSPFARFRQSTRSSRFLCPEIANGPVPAPRRCHHSSETPILPCMAQREGTGKMAIVAASLQRWPSSHLAHHFLGNHLVINVVIWRYVSALQDS